tara:strand:+ start:2757 stop:2942 length:186 start_codon:yes stop_codon:yes gene_type:complete
MTTSKALEIVFKYADWGIQYHDDEDADTQWGEAIEHITDQLGVVFDGATEQWVTADEGHPV